jgi:hypothetical protein
MAFSPNLPFNGESSIQSFDNRALVENDITCLEKGKNVCQKVMLVI